MFHVKHLHKYVSPILSSLGLVGLVVLQISACAANPDCQLQNNCLPTPPRTTPAPSETLIPPTALQTVQPTIASHYPLTTTQVTGLGLPTQPYAAARSIVLERFQNGVMIVFAKSDKGFDSSGGEYIFALAKDGRAWRAADTFVETSKNSDDWYTCQRKPGQRPEKSGVPWRGFGKAWCDHPEIQTALGNTRGYEEADITASFQSFERGRMFLIPDWRGIPGWSTEQAYGVYLDSNDPNFASGHWE
jgi:hypothetical protein